MTVGELINILQKYDANLEVRFEETGLPTEEGIGVVKDENGKDLFVELFIFYML